VSTQARTHARTHTQLNTRRVYTHYWYTQTSSYLSFKHQHPQIIETCTHILQTNKQVVCSGPSFNRKNDRNEEMWHVVI